MQETFLRYQAAGVARSHRRPTSRRSPRGWRSTICVPHGRSGRSIPASGCLSRWPRTTPLSTPRWRTRCRSRSCTCSRSSRRSSGQCSSCARSSTTRTRTSPGSSASRRRTRARSSPARTRTSRGAEAVRGLARGARGGRATLHRSLGDGRYGGAGRGARARRDAVRRRRWEGSGDPRAACRRTARRKGAHRLAPDDARSRRHLRVAAVNGEPGMVYYWPDGRVAGV